MSCIILELKENTKHMKQDYKNEMDKKVANISNLTAEVRNLTHKQQDLKETVNNLVQMNSNLTNNISSLNSMIKDLKQKLENTTQDTDDLRKEIEGLKSTKGEIENALELQKINLSAQISMLNRSLFNLTRRNYELDRNVSNLEAMNKDLKKSLDISLDDSSDENEKMNQINGLLKYPKSEEKTRKNAVSRESFIVAIVFMTLFLVTTLLLLMHVYFLKTSGRKTGKKKKSKDCEMEEKSEDLGQNDTKVFRKRRLDNGSQGGATRKGDRKGKRPKGSPESVRTKGSTKESVDSDWIPDVSHVTARNSKEVSLSRPISTRGTQRSRSVSPTIPLH